MLAFEVKDMSCGHCVGAITQAVQAADPEARVRIDLARHRVEVEPVTGDRARIAQAITVAGYTPTDAGTQLAAGAPVKQGCCCG